MKGFPKAGFFVESLEPYEAAATATAQAVLRAGTGSSARAASGGDGSREKPFKDPWQALEKVEAGDFVHVAEGEYNGKLKTGRWKIDTPYISLLGGYDAQFKRAQPVEAPDAPVRARRLQGPPQRLRHRGRR